MKLTKTTLLSAAVAGLMFGASCSKKEEAVTPPAGANKNAPPVDKKLPADNAAAALEKHACAKLNSCKGKGLSQKNDCKAQGDCATVKHDCATKNACKNQGGCKGAAGKNDCSGKGGCAVPVKPH